MVASPSTRSGRGPLLLALALVVGIAGPALAPRGTAAADRGQVLATRVVSSLIADLDGDGANEIVAIVADTDDPATLRVEAWAVRDASWISLGAAEIEHWDAASGELTTAHLGEESAGLITVRDGGEPEVLVTVGRIDEDGVTSGTCCLSIATLRLADDGPALEPMLSDLGSADSLAVVDLEADGRDELLAMTPLVEEDGPWPYVYTLLRRVGDGFVAEPIDLGDEIAYFNMAADTDGRPGNELLFMTDDNQELVRVAATSNGRLRIDRAPTGDVFTRESGGWIAGVAGGRLILVGERGIVTSRWSPSGLTDVTRGRSSGSFPSVWVLGSGPDARLVEAGGMNATAGEELRLRVYSLDLELELDLVAPPEFDELWQAMQTVLARATGEMPDIYPQMTPIPGGLPDGRPGFYGLGRVVAINPDGSSEVDEAVHLAGGQLLGLAGPGRSWLVRGSGWYGLGSAAWFGGYSEDPAQLAASTIAVMPFDALLGPADALEVTLDGATVLDSADGRRVFAGADGFRATVATEPGMVVLTTVGDGATVSELGGEQTSVGIDLGGRRDANARDTAGMLVIDRFGTVRSVSWDVTILREPPELGVASAFELFEGHATLRGEVAFGTSITVDGQQVKPAADGRFATQVAASPWPRDVVVVARDPIGQEVVRHVEVVGIVDLRALPWLPILVAATLGAGILLFVRTPMLRADARLSRDGDGVLEEIDG